MRASEGQQEHKEQPDVIDVVPKHKLDRAEQQIEKLRRMNGSSGKTIVYAKNWKPPCGPESARPHPIPEAE